MPSATILRTSTRRSPISSYLSACRPTSLYRNYATELPRPPPQTHQPDVEIFDSTSKPRPYNGRHLPPRELPLIKKRWPLLLASSVIGVTGWAAFLFFATNQEKVSSSVVRQIMRTVRENPELRELLGDAIRPEPAWYLNGDPWIDGKINQLQGSIDISFRLKGHKSVGTLYFTSIRKAKGEQFQILRFRVIGDDGTIINISSMSA